MCFTVNDCKRRWKLLRDAFNRNKKQKKLPSGSAGGIIREWKYDKVMSFLLPYMQPRSSRHTLQSEPEPLDMTVAEEDVEPELSELTTFNPLPAIQRPATPLLASGRSATPTPLPSTYTPQITAHRADTPTPTIHPRVQALVTDSQQHKQKRRRTVSPTTTEQQLLDIITQPTTPAPPNVPRQEDEMYYFALSLVPKLNRLLPRNRTRADTDNDLPG
ncbi:uncharacterized protein LOC128016252 [Carassius gibelio]|uniref:uncharacterized protein LOC128016252 n=1 Tax=Carassius gibelio TaxID=101364 RepID=UPI002278C476|nr:uncharacterized protein LOC128016252 [Carassius gibelio]